MGKSERTENSWEKLAPFVMVFAGCMGAIVAMEYVLTADPNAGNLLTFTEFLFVFLQSIPGRLEPGTFRCRPLLASWTSHAMHGVLWTSMSILANYVFAFKISVPIHTLFRSCNVIASVIIGFLLFQQRYSVKQLVCVLFITVGIFCASIGDAQKFMGSSQSCVDCNHAPNVSTPSEHLADGEGNSTAAVAEDNAQDLAIWATGIAMLVFVQMLQGSLGHLQAIYYKRFEERGPRGELADEFLFTSHVLAFLPVLVLWEDILMASHRALASPPVSELLPVPRAIVWLILNNVFQVVCIKGVFRLVAHYEPLTVNITLSVRKFLSVLFSTIWFGNPWTHLHSAATVLIFGGVFAYSQVPGAKKDDKKEKSSAKDEKKEK